MIKKYALDFSIERDCDRCHAVEEILDGLDTDPTPTELEQMASYILYGKDENGQNAIQRNECTDNKKRYNSYRTKEDKVESLDEIMETPGFDEQQMKSAYKRQSYTVPRPTIERPKYDKKTGEMIDPGDSEVPGMKEQWEIIDRWQHTLDVALGKVPPQEGDTLVTDSYRIYQLRHNLIDIRKHQYYLKDSAKPTIHFQNLDHPKTQFYDWCGDSFYWISTQDWEKRVSNSYTSRISTDLRDYTTRVNDKGETEVKWVIQEHTFDWENPLHVRALFNHYHVLYESMHEKLDTYSRALLWDFDRYVSLCDFSELRRYIIELRKLGMAYEEILYAVQSRFAVDYSPNYLVSIGSAEIPKKIAATAKRLRLEADTPPSERKSCIRCSKIFPKDTMFFSRNKSHKDGLSNVCKECDRLSRIRRGVISNGDLRKKDPTVR